MVLGKAAAAWLAMGLSSRMPRRRAAGRGPGRGAGRPQVDGEGAAPEGRRSTASDGRNQRCPVWAQGGGLVLGGDVGERRRGHGG